MRPRFLPEAARCKGDSTPEAAGCRSLATTLIKKQEGGEGVRNPKVCGAKMAQINSSLCELHCFWVLGWVRRG